MLLIRPAVAEDAPLLFAMTREFAAFDNALDRVTNTEADFVRDGFGPAPKFRTVIAEWGGAPAGYALFFDFYSTWRGRMIFLEDLFIRTEFRGKGIGKALLVEVAKIAVAEGCHGLRWEVLNWNEPAINLYKSLGALFLDELRLVILPEKEMRILAGQV